MENHRKNLSPGALKALFFNTALVLASIVLIAAAPAGIPKRFTVSTLTVKDSSTRLVWVRDASLGKRLSWHDAHVFIQDLNISKYAGYSDWRLPSKEEFNSLLSYGLLKAGKGNEHLVPDMLFRTGFINLQEGDYWTSTVNLYYDVEAWIVNIKNSRKATRNKTLYYYVWPVRSGK